MAAQAQVEGRYLGGRPPYGYQVVDAGPHPNPAKAAEGKRLKRLAPDPVTTPVVQRILHEYVTGIGIYALAQRLPSDGIPSRRRMTRIVCVVSVSEGGLDHYAHVLNQCKLLVVG